ncbi:MAG TPA: hypothetical protein VLE23_07240, partial [Geminicoccaceae bacterium]|nr:hypothetical protein [Geminicoccaceae bacterium]
MTRSNNQQHGQRQSELANKAASDNHPLTRPPLLILIDAPLSSRLSRYSVHRGGTTISVDADEAEVGQAVDILEECGAVDLDEREQSWRGEGWAGAVPEGTTSQSRGRTGSVATEAIPVA